MKTDAGIDLLEWRRRAMPWIMALVRLGAGWLVSRVALAALLDAGFVLRAANGVLLCDAVALLLGAGLLAFAWPRTYLPGAVLLALGLGSFEWLWRRSGLSPGPLPWSLGIVGVLALGEWLSRLVQRRYPPD